MRPNLAAPATTCLAAVLCAAAARAQIDGLVAVDQTFADVSPLGASLRDLPVDLRIPADFSRVYRPEEGSGVFLRIAGGVSAVFPRSVYTPVRGGARIEIPPGTIFYLGSLPRSALGLPPLLLPPPPEGFIDLAVPPVPAPVRAEPVPGAVRIPSMFEDEEYRCRRVAGLLRAAAEAERTAAQSAAQESGR
jgi:hypothetical protein